MNTITILLALHFAPAPTYAAVEAVDPITLAVEFEPLHGWDVFYNRNNMTYEELIQKQKQWTLRPDHFWNRDPNYGYGGPQGAAF